MRDTSKESQSGAIECEYAACMLEAQQLKLGYVAFCSNMRKLAEEDAGLRDRLTAEAEEAFTAAEEAGRIVRTCIGCDNKGKRLEGVNQCPKETTDRVAEWLKNVIPVHLFY